ncbi:flavin-containing monooxygenase [Zavarzinia compransoris]|nr:NAD(P)/FAD-dependent oxidoreductase [Zavarzinia compransoris]TDP47909.1 4-hydroxyacetophenone monooxygenase [Zavarzinia compransoris]
MGNPAAQQDPVTIGDDRTIDQAVEAAHIPSLVLALIHLTGDESLLDRVPRPVYDFFGDGQGAIPAAVQAAVRAEAASALKAWRDGRPPAPLPGPAVIRRMMDFIAGADIPERYVPFLLEELAIGGGAPRAAAPAIAVPAAVKAAFPVAVIGAGMSGILAAIELQQAGIPYVIIEKNGDFGGTWHENSYPGCRVDTQNHLYSYSFENNHDWPQFYSDRSVLHAYFRRTAAKYDLGRFTRFRTTVETADYDEGRGRWRLGLRPPDGGAEVIEAAAVISAVGQLNQPRYPEIAGRETFRGPAFHSARWDHSVDLAGKRVAVIGSGASAFQFVPEIAPAAGHLTLFQRSAPWLGPTPDYHENVPAGMQWLLEHMPCYQSWYRFFLFWLMTDGILDAVRIDPEWQGGPQSVSALNEDLRQALSGYIAMQVEDETLRAKVTPAYPPGGKRMLRDNGTWLGALKRGNVTVEDGRIARITPAGIELADGRHVEADVIVYGTGFHASDFLRTLKVRGRGGLDLHQAWAGDARAYLGITMPGFPNFFTVYGPNTNIVVNGSIIFFSECAVRYILGAVKLMLEGGWRAVEVKPAVHDAFNDRVDAANRLMAWGAPQVSSWYKNATGRVGQNWPFALVDYWNATRTPDPEDYILTR